MKNKSKNLYLIPQIPDGQNIIGRLLVSMFGGFDEVLGKDGRIYYILLCRLINKAIYEYSMVNEYCIKESTPSDEIFSHKIIDHLENCVNAVHRANLLAIDMVNRNKLPSSINKNLLLQIKRKLASIKVKEIRHRIEHMNEDLANIGKYPLKGSHSVYFDEKKTSLVINKRKLTLSDLAKNIDLLQGFVDHINISLPNKRTGNKFYY